MSAPAPTVEGLQPETFPEPRRAGIGLVAALVAALALVVYANSLRNGLVYDDPSVITNNEAAHDPRAWRKILLAPSWQVTGAPALAYRPLTTWTFALNYAAHGAHPLGYHVVNVLLHAGVAALLVVLAGSMGLPVWVAGLAGALFAVHPIHTEVVAGVVGRADILAAGLILLALLAERHAEEGRRPLVASLAVLVAYGLAVLAKEHAIALVLAIPLLDLLVSDGGSVRVFARRLPGRRLAVYAALLAVTGGYLVLRRAAIGTVLAPAGGIGYWMNPLAEAPPELRVLTALKLAALGAWLLLVPFRLSADYSYRQITVANGAGETGVLLGLVLAALVAVLTVLLWRRSPRACFWLLLAVLGYAVVSNVAFPIGTIFGERLLYLPSAGVCVLLAMLLATWSRRAAMVVAAALLVAWGTRTVWRNPVWSTDLTLAEAAARDAPDSSHAHHVLGTLYTNLGRYEEALREFDHALRIYPEDTTSLYNAGVVYRQRAQNIHALALFRRVVDIDPTHFPAFINLAATNNAMGAHTPALDWANRAIAAKPDVPNAYLVKGFALRGLNRNLEAREAFEQALRYTPGMPDALFALGATATELEDYPMAIDSFERLVLIAPLAGAYRGLVNAYREAGREEDAERLAAEARGKFPDDAFFAPRASP